MSLPNAEHAVVDIRKLRDYCLDSSHPRGKHKARVFESALGLRRENADQLRSALLTAVQEEEAEQLFTDEYGTRYRIEFDMRTPSHQATVCSIRIVRSDETSLRFDTYHDCCRPVSKFLKNRLMGTAA